MIRVNYTGTGHSDATARGRSQAMNILEHADESRDALIRAALASPAEARDPADQLMHVCVHGLRWSPVNAAHWIADAAWIIRVHPDLDWSVVADEARRRRLGLQLAEALSFVRAMSAARVPDAALEALGAQPTSAFDRLECRLKGRPVVSLGGMFVIWCGWRRAVRLGGRRVGWLPFLSATVGLSSERQLPSWFTRHAVDRLRGLFQRHPQRNAPTRERPSARPAW